MSRGNARAILLVYESFAANHSGWSVVSGCRLSLDQSLLLSYLFPLKVALNRTVDSTKTPFLDTRIDCSYDLNVFLRNSRIICAVDSRETADNKL
ncbi:hypothetical protein Tco_0639157 [Tanacetum coccineum]